MGPKRMAQQKLAKLSERVGEWRQQHGGRGSRIPNEIWKEAIAVARSQGVCATARALGFNQSRLKERVSLVGAPTVQTGRSRKRRAVLVGTAGEGARFVALEVPQQGGVGTAVLELFGGHGDRVRVEGVSGALGYDAHQTRPW